MSPAPPGGRAPDVTVDAYVIAEVGNVKPRGQ